MSRNDSALHASPTDDPQTSLGTFTPAPCRPDGAATLGGLLQLIGIVGLTGMLLGIVASYVSRWFYFIVLFPMAIGLGVAFVGNWCIRRFRIRNPAICGVAGFIVGCLAMLSMHLADYRHFETTLRDNLGPEGEEVRKIALRSEEIRAHWDQATPDEQATITELEKNRDGLRALKVHSPGSYVDMRAHQGVEIRHGSGPGLNLGYYGSFIYWGIEALIVAGMTFVAMRSAAADPYCTSCETWKTAVAYGPFSGTEQLLQDLQAGTLRPFWFTPPEENPDAVITLHTCPACGQEGAIDVTLERQSTNGKGETTRKRLLRVTYPPDAYLPLLAACAAETGPMEHAGQTEIMQQPSANDSTAEDSPPPA